ncbi:MAG: hypothetical protein MHM6MM_003908 [Cercozoa sp. M6MM]
MQELGEKVAFSGVAGAVATTCIFPIDLVKTKMQDQKTSAGQQARYRNPLHCFTSVMRNHGVPGLYKGWPPNVLLVMPEKALKITLNDLFRHQFAKYRFCRDDDDSLSLGAEMAAGALAGFFQVAATNPMELLKIQGVTMGDKLKKGLLKKKPTYGELARSFGARGMYTGVLSTWQRDVPFSAVYFSLYSIGRTELMKTTPLDGNVAGFLAGSFAGTLAAGLTTPLDVIKTRIHAQATSDSQNPKVTGRSFWPQEVRLIASTTRDTVAKEGAAALWKGVLPRCMIIAPLFGITMSVYEGLKSTFGSSRPL